MHKQTETVQRVDVRGMPSLGGKPLLTYPQWGASAHDSAEDVKYGREPNSTIHETVGETP